MNVRVFEHALNNMKYGDVMNIRLKSNDRLIQIDNDEDYQTPNIGFANHRIMDGVLFFQDIYLDEPKSGGVVEETRSYYIDIENIASVEVLNKKRLD
ncbi:MAG: hypothetical protein PUF37_01060 [Prevotellaceae bacterium]|nr:hypothetical protein [Prevotellaceae bacterium]